MVPAEWLTVAKLLDTTAAPASVKPKFARAPGSASSLSWTLVGLGLDTASRPVPSPLSARVCSATRALSPANGFAGSLLSPSSSTAALATGGILSSRPPNT